MQIHCPYPPSSAVALREGNIWAQRSLWTQHLTPRRAWLHQRSLLLRQGCLLSQPTVEAPRLAPHEHPHRFQTVLFSQSRCTVSQAVPLERGPTPPSICSPGLRRQQIVQPCNEDLGCLHKKKPTKPPKNPNQTTTKQNQPSTQF